MSQNTLDEIVEKCETLEFESNDIIFKQGEVSEKLYGVLDGEVELCLVFKDKILKTDIQYEEAIQTRVEVTEKPIVVDTIGHNEVFAWSSFVKPGRTVTIARCLENSRIFAVPAGHLKFLFEKGVLVVGLTYPVVPRGEETLRFQLNAAHTEEDVADVLEVLSQFPS